MPKQKDNLLEGCIVHMFFSPAFLVWKLRFIQATTCTPVVQASKQRAAAAAAAAQANLLNGSVKRQTVTETRRFAGKDIEVCADLTNCITT